MLIWLRLPWAWDHLHSWKMHRFPRGDGKTSLVLCPNLAQIRSENQFLFCKTRKGGPHQRLKSSICRHPEGLPLLTQNFGSNIVDGAQSGGVRSCVECICKVQSLKLFKERSRRHCPRSQFYKQSHPPNSTTRFVAGRVEVPPPTGKGQKILVTAVREIGMLCNQSVFTLCLTGG